MATDNRRVPTVQNRPLTGARTTRRPRHNYFVEFEPFEIQPFCIAPVGAGDSIKSFRFEARMLTDPILNQVTGWWAEMYWFYCPLSILGDSTTEAGVGMNLVKDPSFTGQSGLDQTTRAYHYFRAGESGVNWLYECMIPIVRNYFRRDGEDWDDYEFNTGRPIAGLYGKTWVDTLRDQADFAAGSVTEDYDGYWTAYSEIRAQKLIQDDMTFEEYLRAQGVAVPAQLVENVVDKRKPELLKFVRQFAYPTNTVDPQNAGTQVSAASWVISERCDKRIYCNQPGFIVGVALVRPKVYRANQAGSATSWLRTAREWLPNDTVDAPQNSLIGFDTQSDSAGPLSIATDLDSIVDMAGLWALGDQFVFGTRQPTVALPADAAGLNPTYPDQSSVNALFADDDPGTAVLVQMDGTVAFNIVGRRRLSTIV